jgi:hypothetical protein
MAAHRGGPYRKPPIRDDEAPASDGSILRDATVVLALFATLATIPHWPEAVMAVSEAMGFPHVR